VHYLGQLEDQQFGTAELEREVSIYQEELSPSFLGWNRKNHTPSMLNEAGLIGYPEYNQDTVERELGLASEDLTKE